MNKKMKEKIMKQNKIEFAYQKKGSTLKNARKKTISNHILDRLLDCW